MISFLVGGYGFAPSRPPANSAGGNDHSDFRLGRMPHRRSVSTAQDAVLCPSKVRHTCRKDSITSGTASFVCIPASAAGHSLARQHAREAADFQPTSKAVTAANAITSLLVFTFGCPDQDGKSQSRGMDHAQGLTPSSAGSNASPSTCKSTICCGTRPRT